MNKKLFGTLLLGSLLMGGTFVSCQDYDDDIDNLQNQINQLATKADMQSEVSQLQSALASAQSAANNGVAAAEKALKEAQAAQAAADAAKAAAATKDELAAAEAKAAQAAADVKAAQDAIAAATKKQAELEAALAEVKAFAATLVSTEDFEAAKKELNEKYAALKAAMESATGTADLTGLNVLGVDPADYIIKAGYGVFKGVRGENGKAFDWKGPKAAEIAEIAKDTYLTAVGKSSIKIAVNPTDVDLTKTTFEVVNQFGEVAPIAFGTPTVPTRGAGIYNLPYYAGAITAETAKTFSKNFTGEGSVAVLKAGNIASQVAEKFVTVKQNENHSQSTFKAEVEYAEIDGAATLEAVNPEYVLDAYITKCGADEHDSLVYNIKYDGLTVTYNAAAVKNALKSKATVVIPVSGYQVNLNGLVHKFTANVTLKAEEKEAAKPIEKEVTLETIKHQAVLNIYDKATGKMQDNQKVKVTVKELLAAMGLVEGTDEFIHFNHAEKTIVAGKPYFTINDDKECVDDAKVVVDWLATSTTPVEGKKTLKDWTIQFSEDYLKAGAAPKKEEDAVALGKTVYFPFTITVDDADITDGDLEVATKYEVVVPVKFSNFVATDYFDWNKANAAAGANTIKVDATAHAGVLTNIRDHFQALNGTSVTLTTADTTQVYDKAGTFMYLKPGVTISGGLNAAFVASEKARINAINQAVALAANLTEYGVTVAAGSKVSDQDKKDMIAGLEKTYDNEIMIWDGTYFDVKNYSKDSKGNWSKYDYVATWAGSFSVAPKASTFAANPPINVYCNNNTLADTQLSYLNNTYTINGLKVVVAKREVSVPLSVELYTTTTPTAACTISTALNVGTTYLYNVLYAPANPENFDGSISLKNVAGKTLAIDGTTAPTVASVVELVDGVPTATTLVFAAGRQQYDDTSATPVNREGVKIDAPAGASGKTFKLTLSLDTYVANVETAGDRTPETYDVVVTVK